MTWTTRWWWVRHAPVTVNQGRIYSQTDLPCDTGDQATFINLAGALPRTASWVMTPLQRTHQTAAAIIAEGLPAPPLAEIRIEPDLIEQHFGIWTGQTYDSIAVGNPAGYHRFWLAPAAERPEGGESFVEMVERVGRVIDRLNREFAGHDIVAIAHGGTIRAAVGIALGVPPETALSITVDNLSVTRLDWYGDGAAGRGHAWRVGFINHSFTGQQDFSAHNLLA